MNFLSFLKRPPYSIQWLRILEIVGVMYILMRIAAVHHHFFSPSKLTSSFDYQPLGAIILMAVIGGLLIIIVPDYKTFLRVIRDTAIIWILVIWTSLSSFWSLEPSLALNKSLTLLGMTAFGIFLSLRYKIENQLKILGLVIGIISIENLLLLFTLSEGIDHGVYRGGGRGYFINPSLWKGIFSNSNFLGNVMAQGVLAFFFLIFGKRNRLLSSAGFILCSIFLVGSQSRTSLVALILSVLGFFFLYLIIRQRRIKRPAFSFLIAIIGIIGAGLVYLNYQSVLEVLGTDSTLNNRIKIWTVLWEKIQLHPLLGVGYGNFWRGREIGVSAEVAKEIGWYPFHGHNGFIDLWLELGLIGLLLFWGSVGCAFINGFRRILKSGIENPMDLWPLVYLVFVIVYNCAESNLLGFSRLIWPLLVTAIANLSMQQEAHPSNV